MKKRIDRLFLAAGCLFLALVLVLLIQGVTKSYEKVCDPETYEAAQEMSVYGNGKKSALMRGGRALVYIADSFVYAYNKCGYYDGRLSYLGNKQTDSGRYDADMQEDDEYPVQEQSGVPDVQDVSDNQYSLSDVQYSLSDVQCGLILLYLLIALLLLVPVLTGGFTGHIYVLTGGVLAIILLLGQVPEYKYLVMLVVGWIYVHLIKSWSRMKPDAGFREFLRKFPIMLLPCYGFLLLLFLLLPCLLPVEKLPAADQETKELIFSQLQKIHLVSDQYEENLQQMDQRQENRNDNSGEESEGTVLQENSEADDLLPDEQSSETDETASVSAEGYPDPTERYQESSQQFQEQENLPERGENGSQLQGQTGYGAGFSLNSGGGVSGGRIDRTGDLRFSGKTVLEVTSDSKPDNDLYIRLFYAENYEDNRWNALDYEQYEDADKNVRELTMSVFYALKDGSGSKNIENDVLHLTYTEQKSQELSLNSSRAAEERYPEQEQYIYSVCRMVPEDLVNLFHDRFEDRSGGIFEQESGALSGKEIIGKVKQILGDTAYYTLSPGNAPEDEDFITWFLTENKKGYCMHFASAGVMMLRAAGIPSRYAEGYFVPASAWKEQEDGSWCAQIQDSNAHAWAEIYQTDEEAADANEENINMAGENAADGVPDNDREYLYDTGCWVPVELTPSYDGELAGSFAGQQDIYAGRVAIPGAVIFVIERFLFVTGIVLLAAAGVLGYRKCAAYYEYRMLHTGDNRQDIKNMMKLLLKKMIRRERNVRKLMCTDHLKKEDFIWQISVLIPEFGQDESALEYFNRFSDYVYKAAFAEDISERERKEAQLLYGKLMKIITAKQSHKIIV